MACGMGVAGVGLGVPSTAIKCRSAPLYWPYTQLDRERRRLHSCSVSRTVRGQIRASSLSLVRSGPRRRSSSPSPLISALCPRCQLQCPVQPLVHQSGVRQVGAYGFCQCSLVVVSLMSPNVPIQCCVRLVSTYGASSPHEQPRRRPRRHLRCLLGRLLGLGMSNNDHSTSKLYVRGYRDNTDHNSY